MKLVTSPINKGKVANLTCKKKKSDTLKKKIKDYKTSRKWAVTTLVKQVLSWSSLINKFQMSDTFYRNKYKAKYHFTIIMIK